MLKLYLGRAFSGKTEKILNEAYEIGRKTGVRSVIIVPETHSHSLERRLCDVCGDNAALYAEILTFKRLASRVFAAVGGLADKALDECAKLILMDRAYLSVRNMLSEYSSRDKRLEILRSFISINDEMHNSGISPEMLTEASETCTHERLQNKLHDIALIMTAYDSKVHESSDEQFDTNEELVRVYQRLMSDNTFMNGYNLFIDSFTGFTVQELDIILLMMERCNTVTCAFTCESLFEDEDSAFYNSSSTARKLASAAKEKNISVNTTVFEQKAVHDEIMHLEKYIFEGMKEYEPETEIVKLHISGTLYSECEHAAATIAHAVKESDVRYRDIAVAVTDFEKYRSTIEAVFERFGIPCYISGKTSIMEKPSVAAILSSLKVITDGFKCEDIISCVKAGYSGITPEECGIFENYCDAWSVRGYEIMSEKHFENNPGSFSSPLNDKDKELLDRVNDIKDRIRLPLITLYENMKRETTGRGKAETLYAFLERIGVREELTKRAERLEADGHLREADEYERLWEVICDCFDSFVHVCDDECIDTDTFASLFTLALEGCEMGAIPPSVDRVQIGSVTEISANHAPCVLLLGAVDGALPSSHSSSGILAPKEREEMEKIGINLLNNETKMSSQELFDIYSLVSGARKLLMISYAESSDGGEVQLPSYYIGRIKSLFPNLTVTTDESEDKAYRLCTLDTCIDAAIQGNRLAEAAVRSEDRTAVERIRSRALKRSDSLDDGDDAKMLYGETIGLSASRLETFNKCKFSYMAKYGLKLKPKKRLSFDAPEIGSFLHFVLEGVTREGVRRCGSIGDCSGELLEQITMEKIKEYISEYLGGMVGKSDRFMYLFNRLCRTVYILIENLRREFELSLFEPMDFELDFSWGGDLPPVSFEAAPGIKAVMSGKVDRVDGWLHDGALYIRVADYKSGNKKFSLDDIVNGIGLQLPIYLFSIENSEFEYLRHCGIDGNVKIVPSGVLYVPARAEVAVADRNLDDDELRKELEKKQERSGFVLSGEVQKAMDSSGKYIPVKLSASREITKDHFDVLKDRTFKILKETAKLISEGYAQPDPYKSSDGSSCDFCEYKRVCHFDTRRKTDCFRQPLKTSFEEFFEGSEDE